MKFVVLALLPVLLLICVQEICGQNPEIVNEIWPEVQPVGRTGRLNCTVARLGANGVMWSFEGGKTISISESIKGFNRKLAGKYKYEVKRTVDVDRVTYMLIVRRLVQTDSGKYRCTVRVSGKPTTKWPSKLGLLTVQVAPTINSDADAVKELEGNNNATLKCGASGVPSPNITWTRSDGGLLPILPSPRAQFRGSNLHLINVTARDMGVYRCVADNNIKPPSEHLCEVLVFHSPKTRVVQDSVGQAKNRRLSAKLECIVQGHPVPTVIWSRMVGSEKKEITDDDRYEIHKQTQDNQNLRAMEQWYTLKIKNVQSNDYTTYICEGANKQGKQASRIVLFETTECQGANCPSLNAPGGSTCILPCNISTLLLLLISAWLCRQ